MANVTQSLFGFTPQDIQAQRDAELDRRTAAFAQLTPMQQAQASFYRAGSMFGDAAAGALGYEDPEMSQARARQGLLGGLDMNDPESLLKAAQSVQATDPQAALALVKQANELKGVQTTNAKLKTEAEKAAAAAKLEADLRAELNALPADATPNQIEAVVFKYGDPDKILGVLQKRQDKELTLKAQEAAARQAHLDRLALARENNASREQIAAMNRQFQQQLLSIRQADKQQTAQDKQSNKTLPAALQKAEDDDFTAIDTAQAAVEDISPILSTLKNKQLNLSGFNNIMFKAKAAIGSDDPEVLQYQALQRQLTRFINSTLQLNKGVQTEGDAQRAANELNAAFSANNSKAMETALEEMVKVNRRAATNRQNSINRRRKSQGVTPISGGSIFDAADAILNGN